MAIRRTGGYALTIVLSYMTYSFINKHNSEIIGILNTLYSLTPISTLCAYMLLKEYANTLSNDPGMANFLEISSGNHTSDL